MCCHYTITFLSTNISICQLKLFIVQIAVLADWQISSLIIYLYIRQFCAPSRIRTGTPLRGRDFKSLVSTIPPPGHQWDSHPFLSCYLSIFPATILNITERSYCNYTELWTSSHIVLTLEYHYSYIWVSREPQFNECTSGNGTNPSHCRHWADFKSICFIHNPQILV